MIICMQILMDLSEPVFAKKVPEIIGLVLNLIHCYVHIRFFFSVFLTSNCLVYMYTHFIKNYVPPSFLISLLVPFT